MNLVLALKLGIAAVARATVRYEGRSTAVAVAELRAAEDGRLYATGSTTCLAMAATPPK